MERIRIWTKPCKRIQSSEVQIAPIQEQELAVLPKKPPFRKGDDTYQENYTQCSGSDNDSDLNVQWDQEDIFVK